MRLDWAQLWLQVPDMGCIPEGARARPYSGRAGLLMQEPLVSTLTSAQPVYVPPGQSPGDSRSGPSLRETAQSKLSSHLAPQAKTKHTQDPDQLVPCGQGR